MKHFQILCDKNNHTKRDYIARVTSYDKAQCAEIAKQWGYDYWDGERQYGYGGYKYDGRWKSIAQQFISRYSLTSESKILDIGCGKAFLLYEIQQLLPGIEVHGVDVSQYGIEDAPNELQGCLQLAKADQLPFEDHYFDFVFTINTFHNLYNFELFSALKEMMRVSKEKRFICVESYRNEKEKANLLYWQLTCETFYTPQEWLWFFKLAGYQGDYDFIYFE